jgi:hypothetical protein
VNKPNIIYVRRAPKNQPAGPPTDKKVRPDYSNLTPEQDNHYRTTFMINFGKIRQQYPHYQIPDVGANEDLNLVHDRYDLYVKRIYRDCAVDNRVKFYRIGMMLFFAGVEWIGRKILGFSIEGYCMNQINNINHYENLLIELGEKSPDGITSGWSVESRLLIVILVNMAIFFVFKIFLSFLPNDWITQVQNAAQQFFNGPTIQTNSGANITNPVTPTPVTTTIPGIPSNNGGGGFDVGNMVKGALSMFFGNGNNNQTSADTTPKPATTGRAPRAPRRPRNAD